MSMFYKTAKQHVFHSWTVVGNTDIDILFTRIVSELIKTVVYLV